MSGTAQKAVDPKTTRIVFGSIAGLVGLVSIAGGALVGLVAGYAGGGGNQPPTITLSAPNADFPTIISLHHFLFIVGAWLNRASIYQIGQ